MYNPVQMTIVELGMDRFSPLPRPGCWLLVGAAFRPVAASGSFSYPAAQPDTDVSVRKVSKTSDGIRNQDDEIWLALL